MKWWRAVCIYIVAVGFTWYFSMKIANHILRSTTNLILNIFLFALGWISCLLLVVALIFSKSLISLTTNAIFSTIIHMTWSIIILWIIIASISKHRGNWIWFNHVFAELAMSTVWSYCNIVKINGIFSFIGIIGHILTSKYFLPLDKMTNCILMVYPFITRTIIASSDSSMHLSIGLIVWTFLK